MDYENDITIDANELDVEWLNQANLIHEYGKALADAERETRRMEELLKVIKSEIILEVNKKGCLPDGSKAIAQTTEAYYRTTPKYREAKEEYSETLHEQQIIQSAVFALQQKRSALENLVKLLGAEYFSGPTNPRNLSLEREKKNRKEEVREITMTGSQRKERGRTK